MFCLQFLNGSFRGDKGFPQESDKDFRDNVIKYFVNINEETYLSRKMGEGFVNGRSTSTEFVVHV